MELKFSIITVVLNGAKTIEKTIKSVIDQNFNNFEYIIIDGQSTDGTIEIIKKYEYKIAFWISEKDLGIYDAMNKGLSRAAGDILLFLNADDYFIDHNVIGQINEYFIQNQNIKLIYGKIRWQFFNPDYTLDYSSKLSLNGLRRGKMIFQASTFMKKEVFETIGNFDTKYQISGDFDLFCRFIKSKAEFLYTDKIISNFRSDGKSSNHQLAWKEGAEIIKIHFGRYYAFRFALIKFCELNIKNLLIRLNLITFFRKLRKKIIFANN